MQVFFPSELRAETLPDMPELMSVVDGPIVLAGIISSDCGITGADKLNEQFMPQMEHTYGTFPWRQNSWRTRNQPQSVMFRPLYRSLTRSTPFTSQRSDHFTPIAERYWPGVIPSIFLNTRM